MRRVDPSLWATGQVQPPRQRDDLYTESGTAHPAKMWPHIARAAIDRYSAAGETVLDPMCGIGTVLVEAIRTGRDALGLDCEQEWVRIARTNLTRARKAHPGTAGRVWCADATELHHTLTRHRARLPVDLVVTSPPYGPVVHGRVATTEKTGGKIAWWANRYATGQPHPAQLARGSSLQRLQRGLEAIFDGCHAALRPGGHLVVTARPYTDKGALVDFPALVIAAATAAGFAYADRHAALLARWDGQVLHPHVTFFHPAQVRRAIAAGRRAFVRAHEDVLVFRRPK